MRVVLKGIFLILSVTAFAFAGCGDDTGSDEVCDGRDNDGDGKTDEDYPGLGNACDSDEDEDACQNGQFGCNPTQDGVECLGDFPTPELCNGLDDDCDRCWDEKAGVAGCEPLEQNCSTACGSGTEQCYMGEWRGCTAPQPQEEVCNNQDDDCDGETDEGLDTDADNDGHYSLDSCATPNDDCNDSNENVYPGHAESPNNCDGLDNDCDREIDEGCQCSPGPPPQTQPCSTDIGECVKGNQTCQTDGTWGLCDGVLPQTEECNQKDDDCDGTTDNVTTPPACELTVGVCAGATRTGCEPCDYSDDYEYNNEQTCDGLDNDCDGATDEDLPLDSYEYNEECLNPAVLADLNEDDTASVSKTLYQMQQEQPLEDIDWYMVKAVEDNHICAPFDDQCYFFRVTVHLPQGADHTQWQFCLLDGTGCTCSDFEDPASENTCWFCASESDWNSTGGYYEYGVQWPGTCALIDDRVFYLVVRSATGATVTECEPYQLQMEMDGSQAACP